MKSPERAILRRVAEKDLPMLLNWRNSARVRANMFKDHIISWNEHMEWFNNVKIKDNCDYLIFEYDNEPHGLTSFTNIDRTHNIAQWGFYIGTNCISCGLGTIMGRLSLDYAFNVLKLRKIYGKVFSFNSRSINLFHKFGFQKEGCLRKHILKNGSYEDILIFALFRENWKGCLNE